MEGKHVVITGGTGGLGSAVVQTFIEAGAIVHLPCWEESAPDHFTLADHDRVTCTWSLDLRDERVAVDYFAGLPELWASVHLTGGFAMSPLTDTSLDDFRKMIELNAVTCFLCCREAVRAMRRSGGEGRIVNVGARPVLEPVGGMVAYSASKAAVVTMTRALDAELRHEGILVNAVVPSIIDTPGNRAAMPDADHSRWPKPAELAVTIMTLASPINALTGGALVPVYGRV